MAILLASASPIRAALLSRAGVVHEVVAARIDEAALRAALDAEGASPRDVADALAEAKARKVSGKHQSATVIGCDQVLDLDGRALSKVETRDEAEAQLRALRGRRHDLLSAVVVYRNAQPVWRHVGQVRMHMRDFSDRYLAGYLDRNWPDVRDSVGCYRLEEEGVRLFSRIEGEYFSVLGLPLMELLAHLALSGEIDG